MSYMPNRYYLRKIASNVSGETLKGYMPGRFYLRKIAESTEDIPSKSDMDTLEATITYADQSTETVELYVKSQVSGGS